MRSDGKQNGATAAFTDSGQSLLNFRMHDQAFGVLPRAPGTNGAQGEVWLTPLEMSPSAFGAEVTWPNKGNVYLRRP